MKIFVVVLSNKIENFYFKICILDDDVQALKVFDYNIWKKQSWPAYESINALYILVNLQKSAMIQPWNFLYLLPEIFQQVMLEQLKWKTFYTAFEKL